MRKEDKRLKKVDKYAILHGLYEEWRVKQCVDEVTLHGKISKVQQCKLQFECPLQRVS